MKYQKLIPASVLLLLFTGFIGSNEVHAKCIKWAFGVCVKDDHKIAPNPNNPPYYMWASFPYPMVSMAFTSAERQLIFNSLVKAKELIYSDAIGKCINKYATSGYFGSSPETEARSFAVLASSHPELRPGIGRYMTPASTGGLQYLYIDKIYEEGNNATLGLANVGINVMKTDLRINLNSWQLSSGKWDEYTWAGVIVHEILHNWGYTHPVVMNGDFSNIPGKFNYEVGWCLQRKGSDKLPGSFSLDGIHSSPGLGGVLVD